MFQVYGWLIAIGVLVVQFFLSRRTNVYWGAVLPALYVVFIFIWLPERFGKEITFSIIIAAVAGLVFLLGMWLNGREDLKKKRKKELEKMELHDIE
ncbi:hypothetical protein NDK47_10990 [Brevibacillus ruminantium]|uniref:Uncharacterized protein n=1 Tax=Brevibacillus ruminantium TaxID=2950604 RepID=A0ABY4WKZ4_9BACL|nr:hypothetical protein [Brevibacillus ruminantium]USG67762.1 hypothetical protein NDK47_10990 [Brevibacillus ruminantium]